MTAIVRCVALLLGMQVSQSAHALDYEISAAKAIDVSGGKVVLLGHVRQEKGSGCKSVMIGVVEHKADIIKVGDTIRHRDYTVPVGEIEVQTLLEDISWAGNMIMNKGDSVCIMAEDREALSMDAECSGLWLRADNCKPLR